MNAWQNHVERVQNSSGDVLWRHLYFGNHARTDEPNYIPTERSNRNVWVSGPPGSGKSARCLIPYMAQRVAQGASVVVIGSKPDTLFFHSTRIIAEERGIPFRWLDITPGHASFVMNGLKPWHAKLKSTQGQAETLMQATGLDIGRSREGQFFPKMDELLLMTALAKFPEDQRFADTAKRFEDPHAFKPTVDDRVWRYSMLARAMATQLGNVTPLNPGPKTPALALEQAIELWHPFVRQEVIYFALDTRGFRGTSKAVAGLVFYGLPDVAGFLGERLREHQVVMVMDDAADIIAGDNLAVIFETARDLGVELVIAHQDFTQLVRSGQNIRGAMEANTGLHVVFNPQEEEVRNWIVRTSGERAYPTLSWSQDIYDTSDVQGLPTGGMFGWPTPATIAQRVGPVIDINTVNRLSAEEGIAFVRLTRDGGLAHYHGQWQPVRLDFHISKAEADRRKQMPWPEPTPHTVTVELETEFDGRFKPKPPAPKKGGFGGIPGS